VLCVIQSALALAIGLLVFALPGSFTSFAAAGFIPYATYAALVFVVMVFPKAGVFAPDG
jgi:hypothetical protein